MLAIAQAEAIASALIRRDLADKGDVDARLTELRDRLTGLDADAQDALADMTGVTLIATHPRYQYFARRYGLTMTSLEWEAGATPTAAELAELQTQIDETGAKVLIWEAQPPSEAVAAIEDLGLESAIFEPWANSASAAPFVDAFRSAVSDIADAARRAKD